MTDGSGARRLQRANQTSTHWGAYFTEVRDGRLVGVRPISEDPDPSPIGDNLPDSIDAPCRIRRPAVRLSYLREGPGARPEGRGAEPFVEVSWDRALNLVAGEIERVRTRYGNEAIFGGSYGWASAGRFHHAQSHIHRFLKMAGGYTDSVNSYSFAAGEVILPHIVGEMLPLFTQATVWPVIAGHTELIVAFGGIPLKNAQVNAGGVTRHLTSAWLERCRARGVQFVNVSPLRSDLAEPLAAEWLPIRPNSDTVMMLALAHVLWSEGRADRDFLARYCVGFERFLPYLTGERDGQPKDPEWAAPICEIPAAQIRSLARRMAERRTFLNVSWSLQRADHGEHTYWMAITLAAMLGGIGRPGEGFGLGYGAVARLGSPARLVAGPTVPQGKNPIDSFIPVARIVDMLLSPGAEFDYDGQRRRYPDVHLIYWAGGNPFHHHQDLNRLVRAWRKPDTIVVHEQFWNAHARHADIVLPATTTLERDDIGMSMLDEAFVAMRRCVDPVGEARNDYEIFAGIAERLGFEERYTEGRSAQEWLRSLYEECRGANRARGVELPDFDSFWETGYFALPEPEEPSVLLKSFRQDPTAHPLATPSGRIEIYSERIAGFGYEDCPPHPTWMEPHEWLGSPRAARFPLHLLSNQPSTKLHSQLDHGHYSRAHKIRGREPLSIHPEDAAARGIAAGDIVRVFNDRGACLAGAVLTNAVRQGVVQLATGAWYCPAAPGEPDSLELHGNPNVLTPDVGSSRLAQGPTAHSTLVEVERYPGAPPPITIFSPPELLSTPDTD